MLIPPFFIFFFFNDTATTEIYTLSLHDALPILRSTSARISAHCPSSTEPLESVAAWSRSDRPSRKLPSAAPARGACRSEEHTSELQSPCNLVCRLLLEKKKSTVSYSVLTLAISP